VEKVVKDIPMKMAHHMKMGNRDLPKDVAQDTGDHGVLEVTTKNVVTTKRKTEEKEGREKGMETTPLDAAEDSDVTDVGLAQTEKKNRSPQFRTKQLQHQRLMLLLKTRTINVFII